MADPGIPNPDRIKILVLAAATIHAGSTNPTIEKSVEAANKIFDLVTSGKK